ncbi:hypothetical protein CTAYLR_005940 [Chrysophaeum taylorii]|uniref:Uncharacterized protein n=1 Tax=Chrysophaeum taylorii TaxID=2483200 RepID=A0AAD7UBE1_9STRA|nr:hypothetical protein CTAYLR_005940 [Chrysophaeum taylorii]
MPGFPKCWPTLFEREDHVERVLRHFHAVLPSHYLELALAATLRERPVFKVVGRVEHEEAYLTSALGKSKCVYYAVEVQLKRGARWETVAHEAKRVDFKLVDESGAAVRILKNDQQVEALGYSWEQEELRGGSRAVHFYGKASDELVELLARRGLEPPAEPNALRAREVTFCAGMVVAALGVVVTSGADNEPPTICPIAADSIPSPTLRQWSDKDRRAWEAVVAHDTPRVMLSDKSRVTESILTSAGLSMSTVTFKVPDGASPGSIVPVRLPDKSTFVNCTIPDGVRPGVTVKLSVHAFARSNSSSSSRSNSGRRSF